MSLGAPASDARFMAYHRNRSVGMGRKPRGEPEK
jgi:hypothetical protein